MQSMYQSDLYKRLYDELLTVKMVDTHEHHHLESALPEYLPMSIGRFFSHYASCDLVSAGMSADDLARVTDAKNGLSAWERWQLIKPWYTKASNTSYFDCFRIFLQDLYGIDELTDETVEIVGERMQKLLQPGSTRQIFNKAGIDFAMTQPLGNYATVFNAIEDRDNYIVDMYDCISFFFLDEFSAETGIEIKSLNDYERVIDFYFETYSQYASAFKVGIAYNRALQFDEIDRADAEKLFNRLLAKDLEYFDPEMRLLENHIMHYLCGKCGEYRIRMKFHTGFQEGNGNYIMNSRAGLMTNLFLKYPKTLFDIYHISYPYHEEAFVLAKNFPNVTIDFCFNWICNISATRRALSDALDLIPANKIHGFGGDYIFIEGTYGHAMMARREITRVLTEKVEEGRYSEEQAIKIGTMLLRDNVIENFDLETRRKAFQEYVTDTAKPQR